MPSIVLGAKIISETNIQIPGLEEFSSLDGMRQSPSEAGAQSGDYCYGPGRGQKALIQLGW